MRRARIRAPSQEKRQNRFCAYMYHTRKETNPFNLHHLQTNIKKYSVAGKKGAVLSFLQVYIRLLFLVTASFPGSFLLAP